MKLKKMAVLLASVLALTMAGAVPAAADTDSSSTASAGTTSATTSGAVSPASTITCSSRTDYPHNSSHVNGTINVVGTVTCTGAVVRIQISVDLLIGSGPGIIGSRNTSNTGQASLSTNASTPCSNGSYSGRTSFTVTYPPNYKPQVGSGSSSSPVVQITC